MQHPLSQTPTEDFPHGLHSVHVDVLLAQHRQPRPDGDPAATPGIAAAPAPVADAVDGRSVDAEAWGYESLPERLPYPSLETKRRMAATVMVIGRGDA